MIYLQVLKLKTAYKTYTIELTPELQKAALRRCKTL